MSGDRVAVEAMSIDPGCPGYLLYCWQTGLGQYELDKTDIVWEKVASVKKPYQLQWRGVMEDLPPKLG